MLALCVHVQCDSIVPRWRLVRLGVSRAVRRQNMVGPCTCLLSILFYGLGVCVSVCSNELLTPNIFVVYPALWVGCMC